MPLPKTCSIPLVMPVQVSIKKTYFNPKILLQGCLDIIPWENMGNGAKTVLYPPRCFSLEKLSSRNVRDSCFVCRQNQPMALKVT